jgi:hypothetical protein
MKIIRFIKNIFQKLRIIVNENPKSVFIKTISIIVGIIILFSIIQYNTNILEKRRVKINISMDEIETDIKIFGLEYDALISPIRLRQLSDLYLSNFKDINPSSKVSIKNLNK